MWQHLLDALRALNYVEGQNLVVKLGLAEGRPERLPGLIAELVQAKVDVIVTTSTHETQAAMKATSTIPIVMTLAPDPVEQGLVKSLARPGGNVTGLTTLAPGTSQKLIELLREAVPSASRFGVLRTGVMSPFPRSEPTRSSSDGRDAITLARRGSFAPVQRLQDLEQRSEDERGEPDDPEDRVEVVDVLQPEADARSAPPADLGVGGNLERHSDAEQEDHAHEVEE